MESKDDGEIVEGHFAKEAPESPTPPQPPRMPTMYEMLVARKKALDNDLANLNQLLAELENNKQAIRLVDRVFELIGRPR